MSSGGGTSLDAAAGRLPREMLLAHAWALLGDAVAPLSNASGRPLVRTVRLILDPLVLRPAQNPRLGAGIVGADDADELLRRIADAGPALTATAAWFTRVKQARRRAGVSHGNPQDLYFQRCFELAHRLGHPDDAGDADGVAARVVAETQAERGRGPAAGLRDYITDPAHSAELARMLEATWTSRQCPPAGATPARAVTDVLATCATGPDEDAWRLLVSGRAGTRDAAALEQPGAACGHGLTDRTLIEPPPLGDAASKRNLPKPFDRSILERLFAGLTAGVAPVVDDVGSLVRDEIARSAQPWQLAGEPARVMMVLGIEAGAALKPEPAGAAQVRHDDARARLRSRWRREAYVHRVLRLPASEAAGVPDELRADVRDVRRPYLRRLWVRLHGRELRGRGVEAADVWDLLDGVLRSVILDQRDRLRSALTRRTAQDLP